MVQNRLQCVVAILLILLVFAGCGDGGMHTTGVLSDVGSWDVAEGVQDVDGSEEGREDVALAGDVEAGDVEAGDVEAGDVDLDLGGGDEGEADVWDEEPDVQPDVQPDVGEPAADVSPVPEKFIVWMAANGSDARDGRSSGRAVLTLNRVQEILKASAPKTDVEVRIGAGRYRGQKVVWTFSVPGRTVTLTRLAGETDRPVFDGCVSASNCPGGTWFILQRSDGAETGIVFNYLRVENYQTAISLNGSRNAEASSNGSNRVFGCYFSRIGNVFNSALAPSTAAIRLVNSDDNEIINNHFVDIINTRSPALLHAIYVAHLSDRNQILRNRFENNAGDPIRVRDFSNNNVITGNTFKKVAIDAAYSEWYCEGDKRTDCTKTTPECPSWGNQFRDNHLNGNYACQSLGTFRYYQGDTASGCARPSADAQRLRTSGNTHAARACE